MATVVILVAVIVFTALLLAAATPQPTCAPHAGRLYAVRPVPRASGARQELLTPAEPGVGAQQPGPRATSPNLQPQAAHSRAMLRPQPPQRSPRTAHHLRTGPGRSHAAPRQRRTRGGERR